jgi:hypothetical protein
LLKKHKEWIGKSWFELGDRRTDFSLLQMPVGALRSVVAAAKGSLCARVWWKSPRRIAEKRSILLILKKLRI